MGKLVCSVLMLDPEAGKGEDSSPEGISTCSLVSLCSLILSFFSTVLLFTEGHTRVSFSVKQRQAVRRCTVSYTSQLSDWTHFLKIQSCLFRDFNSISWIDSLCGVSDLQWFTFWVTVKSVQLKIAAGLQFFCWGNEMRADCHTTQE